MINWKSKSLKSATWPPQAPRKVSNKQDKVICPKQNRLVETKKWPYWSLKCPKHIRSRLVNSISIEWYFQTESWHTFKINALLKCPFQALKNCFRRIWTNRLTNTHDYRGCMPAFKMFMRMIVYYKLSRQEISAIQKLVKP